MMASPSNVVASPANGRLGTLAAVLDERIRESIAGLAIAPMMRRYLSGGKRLRGTLVLLPSLATARADIEAALTFATSIELIHAGTLCHDDIVDRSFQRRGEPTFNATHGEHAATLAGLFLLWRAYELIADQPSEVRFTVARTAARLAEGQSEEMCDAWLPVTVDRYLERLRAKTSALFELAAWMGASAARLDPELVARVVKFGGDVGLAFQVADDLRDLTGTADIGRPPGQDLREGVLTMPVLLALADPTAEGTITAALRSVHEGDEDAVERLRTMLVHDGWLHRSEGMLETFWDIAEADLQAVTPIALRDVLAAYLDRIRSLGTGSPSPSLEHSA